MKKTKADAINRRRAANPEDQEDFKRVWELVESHRGELEHYFTVHHWLKTWGNEWKTLTTIFTEQKSGTVEWLDAGLACYDHIGRLFEFLRSRAHQASNAEQEINWIERNRPKSFYRFIRILVLLHLRGIEQKEGRGSRYLRWVLGIEILDMPFPEPPWSQAALLALCKQKNWYRSLPAELKSSKKLRKFFLDDFAQIDMPETSEVVKVISLLYGPGPSWSLGGTTRVTEQIPALAIDVHHGMASPWDPTGKFGPYEPDSYGTD